MWQVKNWKTDSLLEKFFFFAKNIPYWKMSFWKVLQRKLLCRKFLAGKLSVGKFFTGKFLEYSTGIFF
jgi:hypothetical protein